MDSIETALSGGPPRSRPTVLPMPDFAELHRQRQKHPHVTQQLLWDEYLSSAKTKIVVKPPPSPGDTHDASRQAPRSSQRGNPRATCVCGRWPEHYPGGAPEFQDLMRSAVGPDCNAAPIL